MKPHRPSVNQDSLSDLLQEWRIGAELPPRFEEQVWRRIINEEELLQEAGRWVRFRGALEMLFTRPAFATACVIAFLLSGTVAGWLQGQRDVARLNDALGQRYVQLVDPYASPLH